MIQNPCILNDVTKCIGCEECVAACKKVNDLPAEDAPPRVGHSEDGLTADRWTSIVRLPEGANVRKQCRHCLEPACVEACRKEATFFGSREQMLAEAKRRIAAEPDLYTDHVWGEHEVGGTSVLYVSGIDLSAARGTSSFSYWHGSHFED